MLEVKKYLGLFHQTKYPNMEKLVGNTRYYVIQEHAFFKFRLTKAEAAGQKVSEKIFMHNGVEFTWKSVAVKFCGKKRRKYLGISTDFMAPLLIFR